MLAIHSMICQLKLGQFIQYFLRNVFYTKDKKCIFKRHKHPAETSISKVRFIFLTHLPNRKILFLLQTQNHPIYEETKSGERDPQQQRKDSLLTGSAAAPAVTQLLSYALPKNYKSSRDTDGLYRLFNILEETPTPPPPPYAFLCLSWWTSQGPLAFKPNNGSCDAFLPKSITFLNPINANSDCKSSS